MNVEPGVSMILRPRLGVVVSTWSHEDGREYAARLVEAFPRAAPADRVDLVVSPRLLEYEKDIPDLVDSFADAAIDAVLMVPGNFTLDHVLPLAAQAFGLPTILWGIPTREAWGALVSIHQTLYPFHELGLRYRYVVGEIGDARAWDKALAFAKAAALIRRLKGLRIGLMGWRAEGMSDVTFDELALREVFGVQVVNVGLTRYGRTLEAVGEGQIDEVWRDLKPRLITEGLPEPVGRYGVRSYVAMKSLAGEESLQAVTVECFHDHLGGPCLGCSLLNDEGVAAACESDVAGALLMSAGQLLSGTPTFHVDVITADLAENSAILHHCGNLPRRLAEDPSKVSLRAIRENVGPGAYGPTIQATMRPGPITVINLVGRRGTIRMCAFEGKAVSHALEFPGSAAKALFPLPLAQALEDIGERGFGHHFVVVEGHVAEVLKQWCQLLRIDFFNPGDPRG